MSIEFKSVNVLFDGGADSSGTITGTARVEFSTPVHEVAAALTGWTVSFSDQKGTNRNVSTIGARVLRIDGHGTQVITVTVQLQLTDNNNNLIRRELSSASLVVLGT